MSFTVVTPEEDPRAIVLGKLARLSLLKASLKEVLAPYETQIAALQKACHDATLNEVREIERLEDEIKQLAAANPAEVFGESKTIKLNLLSLGARSADKVELLAEEDEVISALEKLAASESKDQRLAAGACLRITKELNKVFIRDQWADNQEWFLALGISVKESMSVSISELKPPKAKVTKERLKDGKEASSNEAVH